jgi:hypothetical protein
MNSAESSLTEMRCQTMQLRLKAPRIVTPPHTNEQHSSAL